MKLDFKGVNLHLGRENIVLLFMPLSSGLAGHCKTLTLPLASWTLPSAKAGVLQIPLVLSDHLNKCVQSVLETMAALGLWIRCCMMLLVLEVPCLPTVHLAIPCLAPGSLPEGFAECYWAVM